LGILSSSAVSELDEQQAKADLFPTIALAGTIGLSKFDSSNIDREGNDLFDSDSLSTNWGNLTEKQ
jgi:outer membrane protein TolC